MNKRISLGLSIALLLLSIAATFSITMSVSRLVYNQQIQDLNRRTQQVDALNDIAQKISKNFYWYDQAETLKLITGLTEGYVNGLEDPYSYYMDTQAYEEYSARMQGQKQGIGALTAFDQEQKQLSIIQVFPSSPSEKSGLKKGDIITKIGDEAVTETNHEHLAEKLTGQLLTSVRITYRRDGAAEKTVTVMLGYQEQTVTSELLGEVAYIKISAFYKNTVADFQKAVDKVSKDGAKAIVFDVRGTTDGSIEYAAQMIDYLVPLPTEGSLAIATLVRRDGSVMQSFSSDANNIPLQMAVLINGNTSGLAELFACDLRDFGKAVLVGDATHGNGTYQTDFRLQEGGAILLTVAMIKPYMSEPFHDKGIPPDISVSLNEQQLDALDLLPREEDAQWKAAQALFMDE